MIPNFALSLSFDGIGLLRRMGPRWALLAEVAIDDPDLDAAMAGLRERAAALDPRGTQVLLIIPNEQIRYIDLADLGGADSARDAAIRTALDGATPYPVTDLTHDHTVSGGRLLIAAVANETLSEAEGFAETYGFTPVGFAAIAPQGAFDGAVFFGRAAAWRRSADRPSRAIEIVAADEAAQTPVAAPAAPAPKELTPVSPDAAKAAPAAAEHEAPAGAKPEAPAGAKPEAPAGAKPEAPAAAKPEAPAAAKPEAPAAAKPEAPAAAKPEAPATAKPEAPAAAKPEAPAAAKSAGSVTVKPAQPTPTPQPPSLDPVAADGRAVGKAADPADLSPLPGMTPLDEEQGSFTFASVRAKRDETIPPAARPLKLGPDSGSSQRPRFSPVAAPRGASPVATAKTEADRSATPQAASPRPDPQVKRPATSEPPASGKTAPPVTRAVAGTPAPQAAKPAATPGPVPPRTPAPDAPVKAAGTPAPKAPAVARGTTDSTGPVPPLKTPTGTPPPGDRVPAPPAATAPEATRPASKPAPTPEAKPPVTQAGPAGAASPAAKPVATGAPTPIAARTATQTPGPNPLARLAALRSQGLSAPAATPAVAAPVMARTVAAAAALPAEDTSRFASAKQAGRTLTSSSEERERMTVFGARHTDTVGGKPRFLGLMLTAALLIFLAGVAAWASVFLDEGLARLFRSPDPETQVASRPVEIDPQPETAVLPDTPPQSEAAEALQLAALDPEPEAGPAPQREAGRDGTTPAPEPASPALSRPEAPRALSPEEAAATYAATGIWQRAPASPLTPPDEGVEDVYVASIDPRVESSDAVALPVALSPTQEPLVEDPGLPPPPGMTFDIDDRGLVRATPEGALTPQGLRIYAGLPPAVPPLRTPPEAEPEAESEEAAPEAPPVVDRLERFRDLRPRARPTDVIEQRERATLQGISRSELAAFRPTARPQSVQEEAEEAEPASPATEQAVLASPPPVQRPGNFAALVRRAESTPQPQAEPVQTAAVAPRTVSPAVPSSASVARSATVRNAINLGRINLIGVYGTPNNRRALVRLANGKYQKVKVGDRLDGGRVAAIGDDELRYTKGSRNLTLDMPGG
ncbi:hypothetical protein [Ponticoccus alexandrii]|uniref:Uncharacterized protein n=1 Tax=Ponticoccus alexandrii TaxID=1943633 RepID=A0ABX7FBG9_9RHOB|nr:hypothetical protein [Ponticoccus alexandrii]QRF67162.1 hypothetical protein GQA70_13090 [Ponticoccus alexandrii]